MIVYNIKV